MPTVDQEIERRLGRIEGDIATLKVLFTEQARGVNEMLACHERTLYGNGDPGLRVTVDRLTQAYRRRDWQGKAIWGAVVAAMVSAVVSGLGVVLR